MLFRPCFRRSALARAALINFSSWTSQVATDINSALTVGGGIGGRDSLTFQGYRSLC
jgi:hypothetical protein